MSKPEISLQNPCRYNDLSRRRLGEWLSLLVESLAPEAASLGVRFTSDYEMREVNLRFRGKDSSTDVLSFPGDLAAPEPGFPEGAERAEGAEETDSAEDTEETAEADGIEEAAAEDGPHLGDIVISVPTARRQAEAAGHGLERELRLLLLHGVLHCLGYDHETDDGEMEALERRLRSRWVADPRSPRRPFDR